MRATTWTQADAGFSLSDLMMTVAVMATMFAMAVPAAKDAVDGMRLSMASREVERELQTARLKAVSANRPMRVRLNCPAVGQLRVVEVTGVATTDMAGNRCDENVYPFPGPKDSDRTTPEHDGPLRRLHFSIAISGQQLHFSPNGVTQQVVSGVPQPLTADATITITKGATSKTVTVNALGKIRLN